MRAALAFWSLLFLLPGTPRCQSEQAWKLTQQAEVFMVDSLDWGRTLQLLQRADSLMQGSPDSAFWAESNFLHAGCRRHKGDFAGALRSLEVPIVFWQKDPAHPGEHLGEALMVRGLCRMDLQQNDAAWSSLQEALSVCMRTVGDNHYKTASVYNAMGMFKERVGEPMSAIAQYQRATDIYNRIAPHPFASYPYYNLGVLYTSRRDFSKATVCLKKAISIREQFFPADHAELYAPVRKLACCLGEAGNLKTALEMNQRAMQIAQKRFGANSQEVALVCSDFSFFSWSGNARLDDGIQFAQKAIAIFERNGQASSGDCGLAYSNLASCYQAKGDHAKALQYHQKALQIRKTIFGETDCDHTAASLQNIAATYASLHAYEMAIRCDTQALSIRLANCEKYHPGTALLYNNIGDYYLQLGLYEPALDYLQKAEEVYGSPKVHGHIQAYRPLETLGRLYLQQGDYARAIFYFDKALATAKKSYEENSPVVARLQLRMAQTKLTQNDFNVAWMFAESALQSAGYDDKVEAPFVRMEGWQTETEILYRQFQSSGDPSYLTEAKIFVQKALDQAYQVALDLSASEQKSRLFFEQSTHFERAIRLEKAWEAAGGDLSENAFDLAERSKAMVLYQSFCNNDFLSAAGISAASADSAQVLVKEILRSEKQRMEKIQSGLSDTDPEVSAVDAELLDRRRRLDDFVRRLEEDYPLYGRLKNATRTVPLHWLQDSLLQKNEAFLEYFAGDSSLFVFVVRRDKWVLEEIPLDFPLEDWISRFRHGIFGYFTAENAARTDALKNSTQLEYLDYGARLHEKLIGPVQHLLPEKIIIAPDGPLSYLPFDALLTGTPTDVNNFKTYPYLLQQHQISYVYSATALRAASDSPQADAPFVAFAPFGSDGGDSGLPASLPHTRTEAEDLRRLTGGDMLVGKAATKEKLVERAGRYRILHLAARGVADNRLGESAYLAFSPNDRTANAVLHVRDLFALRLNAELVVLSVCGSEKVQRGEGTAALSNAFLLAGARSVATSLWEVNDKSAADLMRYFYQELLKGKCKDESLREARKSFLNSAPVRNCHPFFWAALTPAGDMCPLKLLP